MCKFGNRVIGGCTIIMGCLEISKNDRCLECRVGLIMAVGNVTCLCPAGLKMVTGACIDVEGCIAAITVNGAGVCIGCNQHQRMSLVDLKCICPVGYYIDGN